MAARYEFLVTHYVWVWAQVMNVRRLIAAIAKIGREGLQTFRSFANYHTFF